MALSFLCISALSQDYSFRWFAKGCGHQGLRCCWRTLSYLGILMTWRHLILFEESAYTSCGRKQCCQRLWAHNNCWWHTDGYRESWMGKNSRAKSCRNYFHLWRTRMYIFIHICLSLALIIITMPCQAIPKMKTYLISDVIHNSQRRRSRFHTVDSVFL